MSGSDFDPCECILSHEGMMRRLMNILRNTQASCNDRECFNGNNSLIAPQAGDSNMFLIFMTIGWIVLAFFLFMFRPSSLRPQASSKPNTDRNDRQPPSPGIH